MTPDHIETGASRHNAMVEGAPMKYALLIYNTTAEDGPEDAARRPTEAGFAAVLDRPEVAAWVALNLVDSATTDFATTVRGEPGRTLLTDGPFIDSKEFLSGLVLVEADNLDGALAVATELQEKRPRPGAIEVRPILAQRLAAA